MQASREMRRRRGLPVFACASLAGVAVLLSFSVSAQETRTQERTVRDLSTCRCVVSRGAIGLIREANGNVMATQRTGLVPVQANSTMRVPGRVVTGASSSSVVALGDRCEVAVGANESAEITAEQGRLCLRLVGNAPEGAVGMFGGISPVVPLVGALGAGGLAVALFSTNHGHNWAVSR